MSSGNKKKLHFDNPVFANKRIQAVTLANWRRDTPEQFMGILVSEIRYFMERSQINPYRYVFQSGGALIGILEVCREVDPGYPINICVHMRRAEDIRFDSDEKPKWLKRTVREMVELWPNMSDASKLIHLCRVYRALYEGRSSLYEGEEIHITIDAIVAIAGLYGVQILR